MVDTTTTKGSSDTALPDTGEAGAPGIEITTAMVEAGTSAYWNYDLRFNSPEEAVRQIFLDMWNAHRSR